MIGAPGLALAFAAGLVSFLSPCVLPLVPGYLATVAGAGAHERAGRLDWRVLGRSVAFVATFSLIFTTLGLTATSLGSFLFSNRPALNTVAGIAIIALGVLFVASVFVARINREWRIDALAARAGGGGPVLAGAAFALAWTPCIGPTLGAILSLAATQHGTAQGALLLAFYSAGLAVPFLASTAAFNAATRSFALVKRHYGVIQFASGALLLAVGVLVVTGELFQLNIQAQRALGNMGINFFNI